MIKNTYEFTKERYEEFINEKSDNDIVLSLGELFDFDKNQINFELKENKNYYIVLVQLIKIENIYFIINTNLSKKLKNLFPSLISNIKSINNVYQNADECHRNFGELNSKDIDKIKLALDENLFGHSDFKEDLLSKIKDFQILNKLEEERILSVLCVSVQRHDDLPDHLHRMA